VVLPSVGGRSTKKEDAYLSLSDIVSQYQFGKKRMDILTNYRRYDMEIIDLGNLFLDEEDEELWWPWPKPNGCSGSVPYTEDD
jgi:hypothetical protein